MHAGAQMFVHTHTPVWTAHPPHMYFSLSTHRHTRTDTCKMGRKGKQKVRYLHSPGGGGMCSIEKLQSDGRTWFLPRELVFQLLNNHIYLYVLCYTVLCVCVCVCVHVRVSMHACASCIHMHAWLCDRECAHKCLCFYWSTVLNCVSVCVHVHHVYTCMYALMYVMNDMRVLAWTWTRKLYFTRIVV